MSAANQLALLIATMTVQTSGRHVNRTAITNMQTKQISKREAEEEAAYEAWLESLSTEQRPTNAKEYVEAWKQYRARYE